MKDNLSNSQINIIIESIDKQIEDFKNKISELSIAKSKLTGQIGLTYGNSTINKRTNVGKLRLGMGVPKKWVTEAFEELGVLTIIEIKKWSERVKGRKLNDTPIRRAIEKLIEEGVIRQRDDGAYEYINKNLIRQTFNVKEDNDLPF